MANGLTLLAISPPHVASSKEGDRMIEDATSPERLLAKDRTLWTERLVVFGLTVYEIWSLRRGYTKIGSWPARLRETGALLTIAGAILRLRCYQVLGRFFTFKVSHINNGSTSRTLLVDRFLTSDDVGGHPETASPHHRTLPLQHLPSSILHRSDPHASRPRYTLYHLGQLSSLPTPESTSFSPGLIDLDLPPLRLQDRSCAQHDPDPSNRWTCPRSDSRADEAPKRAGPGGRKSPEGRVWGGV